MLKPYCNRMKGSRNLRAVQKKMGFPTTEKKKSKTKRKAKKKKATDIFGVPDVKFPKAPF
jgi:hypothetical protein